MNWICLGQLEDSVYTFSHVIDDSSDADKEAILHELMNTSRIELNGVVWTILEVFYMEASNSFFTTQVPSFTAVPW